MIWVNSSYSFYLLQSVQFVCLFVCFNSMLQFLPWKPGLSQKLSCPQVAAQVQGFPHSSGEKLIQFTGHYRIHRWLWGLFAYYLTHCWVTLLPDHLRYSVSSKAVLPVDGCQNFVVDGENGEMFYAAIMLIPLLQSLFLLVMHNILSYFYFWYMMLSNLKHFVF